MTRQHAIYAALAHFDDPEGFYDELKTRVACRTESQNPLRIPDCYAYLEEQMRPAFEAMSYRCRVYDNPVKGCGPVLLAHRHEGDDLTTVLGYGHGDVVLGMEGRWRENLDPWTLLKVGDKVYGRGTADNKAQHSTHLAALNAVLETRGALGFNHKFIIETGEENGSKGLKELVALHKNAFAADCYFASDGPRVDPALPNLTLGNRGVFNFDLVLTLRDGGHHSGNWGGLLSNPGIILMHALNTIVDNHGRILVKDLLPPPISNTVKDLLKDITRQSPPGAPEIDPEWGEPGLSPAEQVYAWNSFEVLAFKTGNPDNPVNAVPPRAIANCQLRFVVGTDWENIIPNLQKHLDENGFGMIRVQEAPPENATTFAAARTDPDHPWAQWAMAALARATGKKARVVPNSGGSICNDVFQDVLGIPFVWMPLSYTGCSQHAPNEHILWSLTREGMELVTGVYWDLGDPETAYKIEGRAA
ncbi:MAG: M20 family metallopeptidase [Rhodospirillaceae bacterium]